MVCKDGAVCIPYINGTATCQCHRLCSPESDVVCGSDGRTYANLCLLKYENCIQNRAITITRKGFCGRRDRHIHSLQCFLGVSNFHCEMCWWFWPLVAVLRPVARRETFRWEVQQKATKCPRIIDKRWHSSTYPLLGHIPD